MTSYERYLCLVFKDKNKSCSTFILQDICNLKPIFSKHGRLKLISKNWHGPFQQKWTWFWR